jgi:SAM-dependent methyltransferase
MTLEKRFHPSDEPWYEEWFNHDLYSHIYSHRTSLEAEEAVELLLQKTHLPAHSRVLDVCCGNGRHSRVLAQAGMNVVGIDLSHNLLSTAREKSDHLPNVQFIRRDMRQPFPQAPYQCVTNFFTSFGYFDKEEDNLRVLYNVNDCLEIGGWFLFDYLNAPFTQAFLPPDDVFMVGCKEIHQQRQLSHEFVQKKITVIHPDTSSDIFVEKVRLYTVNDFENMFESVGLEIMEVFGNYDGSPLMEYSPRVLILAQKRY